MLSTTKGASGWHRESKREGQISHSILFIFLHSFHVEKPLERMHSIDKMVDDVSKKNVFCEAIIVMFQNLREQLLLLK